MELSATVSQRNNTFSIFGISCCIKNVSIFNCDMSATFTDQIFSRQVTERIIVLFLFYRLPGWNNVYRF